MNVWTYVAIAAGIVTGLIALINTIRMTKKAIKTLKEKETER